MCLVIQPVFFVVVLIKDFNLSDSAMKINSFDVSSLHTPALVVAVL